MDKKIREIAENLSEQDIERIQKIINGETVDAPLGAYDPNFIPVVNELNRMGKLNSAIPDWIVNHKWSSADQQNITSIT